MSREATLFEKQVPSEEPSEQTAAAVSVAMQAKKAKDVTRTEVIFMLANSDLESYPRFIVPSKLLSSSSRMNKLRLRTRALLHEPYPPFLDLVKYLFVIPVRVPVRVSLYLLTGFYF
jgi:hypothetical protein